LERWLSSKAAHTCEICRYQYRVQRRARPVREVREWGGCIFIIRFVFVQFLTAPDYKCERRHLFADACCWLFLTPLAVASATMCLQVCHSFIYIHISSQGAIYYWHQTDDANSILEAARNTNIMNDVDDDSDDVAATERALHVPALIVLAMFIIVTYVVWFCVCFVLFIIYFVNTFAFVIVVGTLSHKDCI
jgi:hypothetical protein